MEDEKRKHILSRIESFIEKLPDGIVYNKDINSYDDLIVSIESDIPFNLSAFRISDDEIKPMHEVLPENHFRNRFSRGRNIEQEYYCERENFDEKIKMLGQFIEQVT